MSIGPGTRLGSYEVVALLGEGGMGQVYRASDTDLGREVALKVLPDAFATDPERVARFEREARTLATLNHPHIAHIYGVERTTTASGARTFALVMELVEGRDLAAHLAAGPLPVADALAIAKQIADALEAAHEAGIVHRDLKPANIKVRDDGTVKVLDFGLAKAMEPAGGAATADLAKSPTLTAHATQLGVILGTAAYMSPEQARGKPVDRRTDIWAFGCVLYEMLTGTRVFASDDVSDTLAFVLTKDPDWSLLPKETPRALKRLLRLCLQKDPRKRLTHIGMARIEMEDGAHDEPPATATPASTGTSGPRAWGPVIGALAAGAGITSVAAWAFVLTSPAPPQQVVRFSIVAPEAVRLGGSAVDRVFDISPDGTQIAYISSLAANAGQLVLQPLDSLRARPLTGIDQARAPFFSNDGKWIGFFDSETGLKRVSATGGPAIPVAKVTFGARGATWGPNDTIVFATADPATGLLSVQAGGGEPVALTTPNLSRGEDHVFPSFLPDGQAVLFTITVPGQPDIQQVAILDLRSKLTKVVLNGAGSARYVEHPSGGPGYLVYAAAGSLRAVRFDTDRLERIGDAVPIEDGVKQGEASFMAQFSVARTGMLVFIPSDEAEELRTIVWVTRDRRETPLKVPPRGYTALRLSPDGKNLAVDIRENQQSDIFIWDLGRESLAQLTSDPGLDVFPVWTPDSRRIVFSSARKGAPNLYWQMADGSGTAHQIWPSVYAQWADSFSPHDDTRLVAHEQSASIDISLYHLDGKTKPEPLITDPRSDRNGAVSPNGRWLAYENNRSGSPEVSVVPFPNVAGGHWVVSTRGGSKPVWSPNGRELFYINSRGSLVSAEVQTEPDFRPGRETELFELKAAGQLANGRHYDVAKDGRFIIIKNLPASEGGQVELASMTVVVNWAQELTAKVGR